MGVPQFERPRLVFPEVYGYLEQDRLDVLETQPDFSGGFGNLPYRTQVLAREVGEIAGIDLQPNSHVLVRTSFVMPGEYQGRKNDTGLFRAGRWHLDRSNMHAAMVSDGLTTQYPVASKEAVAELGKFLGRRLWMPRSQEATMEEVLAAMNRVSDDILRELGFEIKPAKPYVITNHTSPQIHRAAENPTEIPIERHSLLVTDEIPEERLYVR